MRKATIWLMAALLVLACSVPALADQSPGSQVQIKGRLLTDIGWWSKSEELTTSGKDVSTAFVNVPAISYLSARWRSDDATSGGVVELGLKSLQPSATVSLRYAYGWYKIGNCTLLAGQTDNWFGSLSYIPKQYLGTNNNDHIWLFGWGYIWPHRVPQAQITYEKDGWGIQFALEGPRDTSSPGATDMYFTLPRMSLSGQYKAGGFMITPGVSFVRHQLEGTKIDDYDTWAVQVPLMYTTGGLTVKFALHYGQNFYNEYPYYPDLTSVVPNVTTGSIEDTTIYGGMLTAEYKLGALTLAAGVGYEKFENDAWKSYLGYQDDNADRKAYFVSTPYQINPYFGIHPEFAYYDYGDNPENGHDAGHEWMLGVQFRFLF